jgi:hypothetical protein
MASYANPIDQPNPFLTSPLLVLAVRHVRLLPSGETVIEDADALPKHLVRIDYHRVYPAPRTGAPGHRNYPEHGTRMKAY